MYVYFHNVELVLELMFFIKFVHLLIPQNMSLHAKFKDNFDFFMYSEYCIFRANQAKIIKCVMGGTKFASILLKFRIWVSFGMHHRCVKGHNATQKFFNFETPYFTVAVFTIFAISNVDSIVGIYHKIYSMQRILIHIKRRSLC